MNQSNFYIDHPNIELRVLFNKKENPEKIKCFLLRAYSEEYDACDAHALVYFSDINGMKVEGEKVELADYSCFKDPLGQVWDIKDYRESSPPEAPSVIFRLKKGIDIGFFEPSNEDYSDVFENNDNDAFEDVDWGDTSTFNQAAWDNVPDRD